MPPGTAGQAQSPRQLELSSDEITSGTKAAILPTHLGSLPLFFSEAVQAKRMQLEGCPRQRAEG